MYHRMLRETGETGDTKLYLSDESGNQLAMTMGGQIFFAP